ncbi:hypothetical protein [Archangium lipolyticum]|uniref:hypothetical protein n=1 Tax=Archangium lipolyticum TaxID=2970465 RepID=UPI00214A1C0D|nr:hypothetical protein [Archangium lipolyticum]
MSSKCNGSNASRLNRNAAAAPLRLRAVRSLGASPGTEVLARRMALVYLLEALIAYPAREQQLGQATPCDAGSPQPVRLDIR